MKIKTDFVTNSSSVSYIVSVFKIKNLDKLKDFLKEEFGKLGDKIFEKCVMDKEKLIKSLYLDSDEDYMPYNENTKVYEFKELIEDSNLFLASNDKLFANVMDTMTNDNEIIKHIYSNSYEGYNG